jgi:hypothetical protein
MRARTISAINQKRTISVDVADRRLDRMLEIADELDVPLDYVVKLMGRCSYKTFRAFSDNPSTLPRYIQSSVSPYRLQRASA